MRDNTAYLARCSSRVGHRLSRLTDDALLRRLAGLVARDRVTTAALLAHIAEVDARRVYAPAGYSSMHAYCVEELRLSEDAASRRIQAARATRRVPALFEALAEGRLHLTAVCLLAPHATGENADELIQAAAHRGKAEIEAMLLRRLLGRSEHALAHVAVGGAAPGARDGEVAFEGGDGQRGGLLSDNDAVGEHAPAHVADWRDEIVTHSLERVSLHLAVSRSTQEKLRYAQALLSHAVPSGDPAEVLDRALDALIEKVERRRFGVGAGKRRRACGAVSRTGERTAARQPHNQYEAERVLGVGFMENKRREAREARGAGVRAAEKVRDIQACLRRLGCRVEEARRTAEQAVAMLPTAPLEEQLRAALQSIGRRTTAKTIPAPRPPAEAKTGPWRSSVEPAPASATRESNPGPWCIAGS